MLLLFTLACVWPWLGAPRDGTGQAVAEAQAAAPPSTPVTVDPVSFGPLETRIHEQLASSTNADSRDRLLVLRDLVYAMRGRDAAAQRAVYDAVSALLDVEARSAEQAIRLDLPPPVQEEVLAPDRPAPVESPPAPVEPVAPSAADVVGARKALAEARYLDAVAALDGAPATPESLALRREAVDGWARAEREAAGRAFLDARARPRSPERTRALEAVRVRLAAINDRYPENSYAEDIRRNLARVDADLALEQPEGAPR